MDFQVVIPVLISFGISAILGPVVIPFLKKAENGSDRKSRRRTVPSEESRDTYHGRRDVSCIATADHGSVLCKGLSKDHSCAVSDT